MAAVRRNRFICLIPFACMGLMLTITESVASECTGKAPPLACVAVGSFREDGKCYRCTWDRVDKCNAERIGCLMFEPIALQALLVKKGYDIEVDGVIGEETKDAIRDFQSKNGLEVNGVAGTDTMDRLKE
ncbi:MAG: peptidoglycan-binding protein [Hyphomicrobium sp.]|uniref:peptidoglycan-binding domain-containing protein n=1 Tax=Hyphomicrobium sp. TaxID=82 RepID=UPI003D0B3909